MFESGLGILALGYPSAALIWTRCRSIVSGSELLELFSKCAAGPVDVIVWANWCCNRF